MSGELESDNNSWLRAVNDQLGAKIRARRKQLNMSQTQLGAQVGLTFQQVQKYEHGSNRISAARLLDISRVLGVQPVFFLSDMPGPAQAMGVSETQTAFGHAPDQSQELTNAFGQITDPSLRSHVLALVKALASR